MNKAVRSVIKVPAVPDRSNQIVTHEYFDDAIKQIKKNSKEKWKRVFKTYFRNPTNVFSFAWITAMAVVAYHTIENVALEKKSIAIQRVRMEQSNKIVEKLTSDQPIVKPRES